MKTRFPLLFSILTMSLCTLAIQVSSAQTINNRMGKPTDEELNMTVYEPDSAANAVVLYSHTDVRLEYTSIGFQLKYRYKKRIKVLNSNGTDYANVSIPFYSVKSNTYAEDISKPQAASYNLEDGKVVCTKMKKDAVFEEQLNKYYRQLKFTVPQVKEGSIIEYEYTISSNIFYNIREWRAQEEIPVPRTEYEITTPEYFDFNVEQHGAEPIIAKRNTESMTLMLGNGRSISCNAETYTFEGNKMSALHEDEYVWCADNFCTQVNFELKGIQIDARRTL